MDSRGQYIKEEIAVGEKSSVCKMKKACQNKDVWFDIEVCEAVNEKRY